MGIFDIFKKKNTTTASEKITQRTRTLPVEINGIPSDIIDLLWFFDGPLENISSDSDEPSGISFSLPVKEGAADKLNYWPSYSQMTPAQRYNYLNWLKDITQPTDMGNVFTFFYGLERYLMTDKYDEAVKKIIILQKAHKNNSFNYYSNAALIYLALTLKDSNYLKMMDLDTKNASLFVLAKASLDRKLMSQDIIKMSRSFLWDNQRYIKQAYSKFKDNMEYIMEINWETKYYRIPDNLGKVPTTQLILSNISLDPEITKVNINSELAMSIKINMPKKILIPDISESTVVRSEIYALLKNTHEMTKKQLAEERKQKRALQ
ncbi:MULTISPECIES: TerB N-terminal domain-containing protein [unclassified Enterococcus]|jgi:hypothetical protein|uniref:TerB N-terminal domain-containing protein n=1 Tax=unclassified Enterococcus TaxID=2608891 RepID=UPI003D29A00B